MQEDYEYLLSISELEFFDTLFTEVPSDDYTEALEKNIENMENIKDKDSNLLFKLGYTYICISYENKNSSEKAGECFQKCIELENSWGYIGMYLTSKDYYDFYNLEDNEFKKYIDKAAKLNNPIALLLLGYYNLKTNSKLAIEYFERAIKYGDRNFAIRELHGIYVHNKDYKNLLKHRLKMFDLKLNIDPKNDIILDELSKEYYNFVEEEYLCMKLKDK